MTPKRLHLYSNDLIISLKHNTVSAEERVWERKYVFPYLGTTSENTQTGSEFNWS